MNKMSIKTAILIPALAVLVSGIVVVVAMVSFFSSQTANQLTHEVVESTVNGYINEFNSISRDAYGAISAVAPIVQTLSESSQNPREDILRVLEGALLSGDSILSIWTCWEPNMLDGRDREFANTANHDSTGRFIPAIFKTENGLLFEPLIDYDDPVAGDFYQGAKSRAKPHITDPYYYETESGQILVYTISIPIIRGNKVVGAVGADINLEDLIVAMNSGKILEDGYIYTISPGGLISTHSNSELLMVNYGTTWMKDYRTNVESVIQKGGSFSTQADSNITNTKMQFLGTGTMIGDTGRYWVVCGVVPVKTINASSRALMWTTILMGALLVVVAGITILIIVGRRLKDLPAITATAEAIAIGDIDVSGLENTTGQTKNEISLLSRAFVKMAAAITQQADKLSQLSRGDYSGNIDVRSDKDIMNRAINSMIDMTNQTLGQINSASEQLSVGARQIAHGSQSLASGATEQAASIEEFSSTISEIDEQTSRSVGMAAKAAELSTNVKNQADEGSKQMADMMEAVREISRSSQDIGKVIKVIDDIAFQTNILSLNAAVEAARAGAAGKGFAVVAEEVRNLAAKSAEAAKDTGSLITNSISKAESGVEIAGKTAAALGEIVDGVVQTSELIQNISEAASEQSHAISQINLGIGQVAQVVQTNSSTAEESAAASEQMSSQADLMASLVRQFKLKEH